MKENKFTGEIPFIIYNTLKGRGDLFSEYETIDTIESLFDQDYFGGACNLIPSDHKSGCHKMALFISLTKPIKRYNLRQDQFISIDKMLPLVVQQVQGSCFGKNKKVAIIIDEINTGLFEPWINNLAVIRNSCDEFGIFYLGDRNLTDITDIIL